MKYGKYCKYDLPELSISDWVNVHIERFYFSLIYRVLQPRLRVIESGLETPTHLASHDVFEIITGTQKHCKEMSKVTHGNSNKTIKMEFSINMPRRKALLLTRTVWPASYMQLFQTGLKSYVSY